MGTAENLAAIVRALGLTAQLAYPNRRMPKMDKPVVMVGVTEQKMQPLSLAESAAFCCALSCEETVRLDLYSPYLFGGEACERTADNIVSALAQAFSTLSLHSVCRDATYYDADTDCFRCHLTVVTKAVLTATE